MAGSKGVILYLVVTLIAISSLSELASAATQPTAEDKAEYLAWIERARSKYDSTATSETTVPEEGGFAEAKEDSTTIIVDGSGKGDYKTVSKAVKAIPDKSTTRYIILVKPGVYKEKVLIPPTKGPISLIGGGNTNTKITYDDDATKAGGTLLSSSVKVYSDDFIAKDIAFENTSPSPPPGAVGKQAVAFMVAGDKAAFYRVAFLGFQDTLYDRLGRHYFKDSYIRGTIDFIFGDGKSYYETSYLDSISPTFGSLSAQKRLSKSDDTGFSFVNSIVSGPKGYSYLGRAWGPYSRVVISKTYLPVSIRPEGWFDWGIPGRYKTVYYGEFQNYGPGANRQGREPWSVELTPQQAAPFQTTSWIDGASWLPKGPQ